MPIALCSDLQTLTAFSPAWAGDKLAVLLTDGPSSLADPLRSVLADLLVVEVSSPRFSRLNFDAIGLLLLDLSEATLLDGRGRRLVDALARLAEQSLTLALVGPTTACAGGFLLDGVRAGLGLAPRTVILPDIHLVADLRTLLERLSAQKLRLLALDGSVAVRYDAATDQVAVSGAGSVLLVAFRIASADSRPIARLHALTDGMRAGWPE